MTFFAFLGALSLSVLGFEILSAFQNAFSTFGSNRLMNIGATAPVARRSTWDALLVAILPGRFDPNQAKNMTDVISLLRRAGYPYDTPGDFYAAAIRDFSMFLFVGGMIAGALATMGMVAFAPVIAMIFILLGLRRPYVRLKTLCKVEDSRKTTRRRITEQYADRAFCFELTPIFRRRRTGSLASSVDCGWSIL
jgi:hypothetical protein